MIQKILTSPYAFVILLFLALLVRLYGLSNPVADWHSWRQSDTSSVSRNLLKNNFDLLHPTYHDLSNVPSGKDNPNGYRFVEFPLYNAAQAGLFTTLGIFTLEEWGRLVTIFSSLLTITFLYLFVKKYADTTAAFFTSFFFAFLPFNIFYGRVILPDPHMEMSIMGGIYFFDRFISQEKSGRRSFVSLILSILFTATALLLKPYAIFFTLPMLVILLQTYGFSFLKKWKIYLFAFLTLLPLLLWRNWMTQFPEGIPVSNWLFNEGNIRFKGAFFYWIFADRLGRLILGYWGLFIFGIGILINSRPNHLKKSGILFYSFLFSSLLYLTVIARGNVQHDYYQILILPSVSIFLGLGASFLLRPPLEFINRFISISLLVVSIVFTFLFGWYFIRDYYNINNPKIVEAGKVVDELTPKDAKVIALYDGDTSFLYQTNRSGWASYQDSLPVLIEKGADYLVMLDPSENDIASLGAQYTIVRNSQSFLLVKLKK